MYDQAVELFLMLHGGSYTGLEVMIFMPPKELWEAYGNHTVRPSRFVYGVYLLYSLG